jgi:hypothetical protein
MNWLIPTIIGIAVITFFIWPRAKVKVSKVSYEKELLQKCFGDKDKAERLINHELKRKPNLTRENAARVASDSITRDNR